MRRNCGRKCLNCHVLFTPDPRTSHCQRFCSKPECKKVSKARSQKRWLRKPGNRNHFRGSANVERVRQWRAAHPGYWRRKKASGKSPLQEDGKAQETCSQQVVVPSALSALQDDLGIQPAVLVGIIATMTGFALQEDIAPVFRSMVARGRDILSGRGARCVSGLDLDVAQSNETEVSSTSRPAATRAAPV